MSAAAPDLPPDTLPSALPSVVSTKRDVAVAYSVLQIKEMILPCLQSRWLHSLTSLLPQIDVVDFQILMSFSVVLLKREARYFSVTNRLPWLNLSPKIE
jgi:hypothetical protein